MASARNVHELGSVMNTESNQSSGNRYQDSSAPEEAQRTGAFGWGEPAGPVPPWSVPPGLMVPGPRRPLADAGAPGDESSPDDPAQTDRDPGFSNQHSPAEDPADEHGVWPGVAAPAGWFLRPQETPAPSAEAWDSKGVPSPHRDPDGSWSSPLTQPPARSLGPTKAVGGRPGGPGFQPNRAGEAVRPASAGLSPWQKSHHQWNAA